MSIFIGSIYTGKYKVIVIDKNSGKEKTIAKDKTRSQAIAISKKLRAKKSIISYIFKQ